MLAGDTGDEVRSSILTHDSLPLHHRNPMRSVSASVRGHITSTVDVSWVNQTGSLTFDIPGDPCTLRVSDDPSRRLILFASFVVGSPSLREDGPNLIAANKSTNNATQKIETQPTT